MKFQRKNSDKKREIINKYDSTSHFYDDRYKSLQQEKYKIILEGFALKDKIILDAGCGTGLLFDFIIENCKQDSYQNFCYIGIDISIKMLTNFEVKIKKKLNIIQQKINLFLADIENLPIRKNIFNSAFSLTSLQNLPNIVDGINEILRVVKNKADLKMSILKKNLAVHELSSFLKQKIINLEMINEDNIEDLIIHGIVSKE